MIKCRKEMKKKIKPKPKETKPRRWKAAHKLNQILDKELKARLEREE